MVHNLYAIKSIKKCKYEWNYISIQFSVFLVFESWLNGITPNIGNLKTVDVQFRTFNDKSFIFKWFFNNNFFNIAL